MESEIKLNEDLGILVGLLLTDGCVRKRKCKITFTNKSESLQNFFKTKFVNVFGPTNFIEIQRENGVKNIEVNNKQAVTTLLKFTPTYRTKKFSDGTFPDVKIPEFVYKLPEKSIYKILQGMFSADGTATISVRWEKRRKKWTLSRRVKLASQNPQIKQQVATLLEKVGFNPSIQCDGVSLEKKNDILKFAQEVGFVEGVKVGQNKIWKGKDKNAILNLLVRTFKISQTELNKFKSKEEIINFLNSFL